jgi:hypothetical protein
MQSSIRAARRVGVSRHVPGRAACPRRLYYRRYYTGAAISMSELAEADRRCPDLPTAEHLHGRLQETLAQPKPGARPAAQRATRPRPRPNRVCKVGEARSKTRSRWKPKADIDVKTAAASASTATGLRDTTRICNSGDGASHVPQRSFCRFFTPCNLQHNLFQ